MVYGVLSAGRLNGPIKSQDIPMVAAFPAVTVVVVDGTFKRVGVQPLMS